MIKRAFFGFSRAHLNYDKLTGPPKAPLEIPVSGTATFLLKGDLATADASRVATGQKVKTGQKLPLAATGGAYGLSSVTGTVSKVAAYSGDFGNAWTEVTVDVVGDELADEQFQSVAADSDLATALAYLAPVPGAPDLALLADAEKPIHTIVVNGVDKDLLCTTAQYFATMEIDALTSGIRALRKITGLDNIVLAVPRDLTPGYGHIGASLKAVDTRYPAGLPHNIMNDVLGQAVPAGQTCADMGVCFFSAEAVASIGKAYDTGRIPVDKVMTVVDKTGNQCMVSARIGTPIGDVLRTLGITVKEKDRIIIGGPMTGTAVYSEDHPVEPDADAILVQDSEEIPFSSDYPCINCGECIRVCPTHVPVGMLVRLLEAEQYAEAADAYDLFSCVECGLCSFVCVAKIPIFQYIKLAKNELGRINTAEASNE